MFKFYYGCMGSGKTTTLVATYEIYTLKNQKPIVIKPAIDDREGEQRGWGTTASRTFPEKKIPCYYFKDIREIFHEDVIPYFKTLIIDEAQFLKKDEVALLHYQSMMRGNTVLAYGLERDVNGNLFEGSRALKQYADLCVELPSLCNEPSCREPAKVHARYINGERDRSTKSVAIEKDNITYKSLCWKHWKDGR